MRVIHLLRLLFIGSIGLQLILIEFYWSYKNSVAQPDSGELEFFIRFMIANLVVLVLSMFFGTTKQGITIIRERSIHVITKRDISHIIKSTIMSVPATFIIIIILLNMFPGLDVSYRKIFFEPIAHSIGFYTIMIVVYPILSKIFQKWDIKFM